MKPFKPILTGLVIFALALFSSVAINQAQGVFGTGIVDNVTYGGSATLTSTNSVYIINVGSSTATLPTAAGILGKIYTIKSINVTATVATSNSEKIDGASTYSLSASNKLVRVISDGTNWINISSN